VLIRLETQWLLMVALIATRVAALLWLAPLFTLGKIPNRVLVLMIIIFSAGLASLNPAGISEEALAAGHLYTASGWVLAAFHELVIGLIMAFGLHCAFAAFSFGGRLLDQQIGFGVASLINPGNNEQESLLGTALLAVGVLTFFLLDGHLMVVKSVAQSLQWFPVGRSIGELPLGPIVAQFGLMFSLGVVLVAPVVAALLMVDVAMAMAARTMPQMNIFMLSIPVKIIVGLLLLAASTAFMPGVLRRIYESIFAYWASLVS